MHRAGGGRCSLILHYILCGFWVVGVVMVKPSKSKRFLRAGGEFGEPLGANIGSLGRVVGWRGGGGGGGVSGSVGWWGCGVGLWGGGWCVP